MNSNLQFAIIFHFISLNAKFIRIQQIFLFFCIFRISYYSNYNEAFLDRSIWIAKQSKIYDTFSVIAVVINAIHIEVWYYSIIKFYSTLLQKSDCVGFDCLVSNHINYVLNVLYKKYGLNSYLNCLHHWGLDCPDSWYLGSRATLHLLSWLRMSKKTKPECQTFTLTVK